MSPVRNCISGWQPCAAMANGNDNRTIKLAVPFLLCLICVKSAQLSDTTDNHARRVGFTETISDKLCNDSTTFQIPDYCIEVALAHGHFRYDFDRHEMRLNLDSHDTGAVKNYKFVGPNNDTVHFCFPLTPQLLNCNLRRFGPSCYELYHHKLTIPGSNFSAELGDYYLDSDNNAFVCADPILPDKNRPRCNNVDLEFGQYVINEDGSLYVNATNTTIRKPQYQVEEIDKKIRMCYPLSIPFLNCHVESAMLLHNYLYDRMPEMKIFFRSYRTMYSVDEYYSMNNNGADFIACAPENPLDAIILRFLYNILKSISCVLLMLLISHHLMAPKMTVHAKCLVSAYISGIAFYIVTIIPVMECYTSFVTIYLTSNAAVIWVNIVSYDIWKSFTRLRKSPNKDTFKNKRFTYLYFCIIGWGAPVVLCILSLILDQYYGMKNVLFLSPLIGLNYNCWYHDKWVSFGFHYSVVLILSLVNAIFFLLTIYSIYKGSKGTEIVNKHRKTQMYIVRFKLFILMGCVLVMEGVTWCFQEHFNFQFWFIADAFISNQGITVFVAETCKRGSFQLMIDRFWLNFGKLERKWNLSFIRSKSSSTSSQVTTSDTAVNV